MSVPDDATQDLGMPRPPWCPDRRCSPQGPTRGAIDGGPGAGFCSGQLAEADSDVRHVTRTVTREVTGHFCVRSSQGVMRLDVTESDLSLIAWSAMHSLAARRPERPFDLPWFTGRRNRL